MADDISKKILITAESKIGSVKEDILSLNQSLEQQLTTQKLLELQGKRNSDAYIDISSQVRLTKQAIRDSNKELDNAVKAFNAQSNSIQQNRALLSTLTAEYIKLSQAEGNTSAATIKMKGDIDRLTTTLKDQEKAIGQSNRNVGNYEESISRALSKINPGFQQFGGSISEIVKIGGFLPTVLKTAGNAITSFIGNAGRTVVNGFGMMKQSAGAATEEIEANTEALNEVAPAAEETAAATAGTATAFEVLGSAVSAIIAIFLVGMTAVQKWFSFMQTFQPQADKWAQNMAGWKAAANSIAVTIKNGDWGSMAKNFREAGDEAKTTTGYLQDLNREQLISNTLSQAEDAQVRDNMLKMRDRATSASEANKIYSDTLSILQNQYNRVSALAKDSYDKTIRQAIASYSLNEEQRKGLLDLSHGYQATLQYAERLQYLGVVNKDLLQKMATAMEPIIQADAKLEQRDQLIQNREDQKKAKAEEAKQKAAADAAKGREQLAEAQHELDEINNERIISIGREYELQMDSYSKELAAVDSHFSELLFKNAQFIANQEKLKAKTKNPDAKAKYDESIKAAYLYQEQLEKEHQNNLEEIITNGNKRAIEATKKTFNELINIKNESIKNDEQRQLAQLAQQEEEEKEGLKNQTDNLEQNINERKNIIANKEKELVTTKTDIQKKALSEEIASLNIVQNKELDDLGTFWEIYLAMTKKYAEAVKSVKEDAAAEAQKNIDEANVLKTGVDGASPDIKANLAAQQKMLDDDHDFNLKKLIDGKITADEFYKIDQKYITDSNALKNKAAKDHKKDQLKLANDIASSGFEIARQAIQRQSQVQEVAMENQKNHDLQNQSLTSTQKYEINEKYRILEGQQKQKEFKDNQKLAIAQALINGALAMMKTTANTGFPLAFAFDPIVAAQTALEIGVIAAQKAPAYATGGVHYQSNGKGSLLKGPGTGTSDSMNARLSNGESVINAKSTSMFAPLLSAINEAGGGISFGSVSQIKNPWITQGFASGGVFNTYMPVGDSGMRPQTVTTNNRIHPDDINSMVTGIVSGVNNAVKNMPAPVTDIKDINYQNKRLSNVYDRINY
jgi:hypothetical protein